MSRWFIFVFGLVLIVAACTEVAETTTTSATSTTTTSTTATAFGVTDTITAPSTTTTIDAPTTTTGSKVTTVEIVVTGGMVERVERFDVPLNTPVRVTVTADSADEVHLHGYDLRADVTPISGAVLEFDATIPGVFEVELEGSGVLIGELQVAP